MIHYCIVVANASIAHIYAVVQEKQTRQWELLTTLLHPESRMKTRDLVSDAPGHYKAPNAERGTFSENNVKAEEAEKFAREITKLLHHNFLNSPKFTHLILTASPHFYGILNKHLDSHLKNVLEKTIQKDYTHLTPRELEKVLL